MKNKIFIKVYVVSVSEEYEMFIPVNESIKKVIELIVKSVIELSDNRLKNDNYCLMNSETNYVYNYSDIIRNTDIVNCKKLFLI